MILRPAHMEEAELCYQFPENKFQRKNLEKKADENSMKLFEVANQYCKESTWKTIAALKFCLLSIGIAIGVFIPATYRTIVLVICAVVFIVTCIPLMTKLFKLWRAHK